MVVMNIEVYNKNMKFNIGRCIFIYFSYEFICLLEVSFVYKCIFCFNLK